MEEIELRQVPITDASARQICGLSKLKRLLIQTDGLSAAGLWELTKLKDLEDIALVRQKIPTTEEIPALHALANLIEENQVKHGK